MYKINLHKRYSRPKKKKLTMPNLIIKQPKPKLITFYIQLNMWPHISFQTLRDKQSAMTLSFPLTCSIMILTSCKNKLQFISLLF